MIYTAEQLERNFKDLSRIRKGKEYENDAGYWTGGRCDWGGNHNLKEDCETLSKAFNKMESLREIKDELKKCTNKSEYNAKKANYIRKCEELISGLQAKTSSSSSMFGICIIWSDEAMDKHVISKLEIIRSSLVNLKSQLERENYKWVQELNKINQEVGKLEAEIQNQRKEALNEKDPVRRAKILQVIEEKGKSLEEKYRKKQELSNKFNFDPSKKIGDLINSIKNALENSGSSSSSNKTNGNNNSDDQNSSNNNIPNNSNSSENQNPDWFPQNQPLIIFGVIALLILYFYYSQEEEPNYYDF